MIVDGSDTLRPAITTYLRMGADIGTPGVRTGFANDVYLTLEPGAEDGGTTATIRAFVKPMILWLWIGGLVMAIGTLLAAFPGSRRRDPLDPVSAPVPVDAESPPSVSSAPPVEDEAPAERVEAPT